MYQESGNKELAKSFLNELKIVYFFYALSKYSPVNFGAFFAMNILDNCNLVVKRYLLGISAYEKLANLSVIFVDQNFYAP